MTKLSAINYTTDLSSNESTTGPRPLARAFPFETTASAEDVERYGFFKPSELLNVQVGETIIVYGPGYMRTFKLAGKNGDGVHLQKIGDEAGPDQVIKTDLTIPAGEVFGSVDMSAIGFDIDLGMVGATANTDFEPFSISVDQNVIYIDVAVADVRDRHFSVRITT